VGFIDTNGCFDYAQVHDLTLVTFNDADFKRFDGLRILVWW